MSNFTPPYQYISAAELAALVKSDQDSSAQTSTVQVIDVRGDDFVGGNIVGAHNSPSTQFHDDVKDLVKKYQDTPKVVFHCALSQVRGPKAARIYSEIQKELNPEKKQEVYVLRDGFGGFQQLYRVSNTSDSRLW